MTGFELWNSGIGSYRSTNWVTSTAQFYSFYSRPNEHLHFKAYLMASLDGYFMIAATVENNGLCFTKLAGIANLVI